MEKIIIVKKSKIHGRGVFAAREIRAGDILINWAKCMEILEEHDVEALPCEKRKRVSFIDGQYILFHPPACWVNHSCEANARGTKGCDVAIRAIKSGEEVTVDYALERVPDLNFRCHCESPSCRGLLTSASSKRKHNGKSS